MFVTSDIFDLERIGRFKRLRWRENLFGGVAVYGTEWWGYEAGTRFLLEASKRCGLFGHMVYAGYGRPDLKRTRAIAPKSFERLTRGELAGAKSADSVLLRGQYPAPGSRAGVAVIGGEASGSRRKIRGPKGSIDVQGYPYKAFEADFVFPVGGHPAETACDLFRLATEILGAEYGCHFVRDDLCGPWFYNSAVSALLDSGILAHQDGDDAAAWTYWVRAGDLWTDKWPLLRDLFQVNLLSRRHTETPIDGLGYLRDWISAASGRGHIQELGDGRLLWILTDAEMVEVRPVLNEAGLLMSCRERVYRDLPHGAAVAKRLYEEQRLPYAP